MTAEALTFKRSKKLWKGRENNMQITNEAKNAILDCLANAAYTSTNAQELYDALAAAFFPIDSITAVYTQTETVYATTSLDSLRSDLVVTAIYEGGATETVTTYTLSGTLAVGTSTITASYAGKTATFSVTVSAPPAQIIGLQGIGIGPASGNTNMWLNGQDPRACLVYDTGDNPYPVKPGSNIPGSYYPIPIPAGSTSVTLTMPSDLYVGCRTCYWTGSQYDGGYSSAWTAAGSATFDLTSYNDGSWFLCFTFKIGSSGTTSMKNYDMSQISVSIT